MVVDVHRQSAAQNLGESEKNTALVFVPGQSLPAGAYEVDYFLSVDTSSQVDAVAHLKFRTLRKTSSTSDP